MVASGNAAAQHDEQVAAHESQLQSDWQSSAAEAGTGRITDLPQGFLVAQRYEIVRKIDAGGHSRVYAAREVDATGKSTDRVIVLKVSKAWTSSHHQADEQAKRKIGDLHDEADMYNKLYAAGRDKAISCGILQVETPPEAYTLDNKMHRFLVMEHCRKSLYDLARRPWPDPESPTSWLSLHPKFFVRYAHQMLSALQYVHSCGIVHRDVKPANFCLAERGTKCQACIIDMGLATTWLRDRQAVEQQDGSAYSIFVGTPVYASSRALSGFVQGPCDDLEGLCYSLFEMLAGTALPWGACFDRVLQVSNHWSHKSLSELPDLRDLIWRKLAELRLIPDFLLLWHEAVCELHSTDEPDYDIFHDLLETCICDGIDLKPAAPAIAVCVAQGLGEIRKRRKAARKRTQEAPTQAPEPERIVHSASLIELSGQAEGGGNVSVPAAQAPLQPPSPLPQPLQLQPPQQQPMVRPAAVKRQRDDCDVPPLGSDDDRHLLLYPPAQACTGNEWVGYDDNVEADCEASAESGPISRASGCRVRQHIMASALEIFQELDGGVSHTVELDESYYEAPANSHEAAPHTYFVDTASCGGYSDGRAHSMAFGSTAAGAAAAPAEVHRAMSSCGEVSHGWSDQRRRWQAGHRAESVSSAGGYSTAAAAGRRRPRESFSDVSQEVDQQQRKQARGSALQASPVIVFLEDPEAEAAAPALDLQADEEVAVAAAAGRDGLGKGILNRMGKVVHGFVAQAWSHLLMPDSPEE